MSRFFPLLLALGVVPGWVFAGQPQISAVRQTIFAGDPNGSPPDSPDLRIDPNTNVQPWGGVGSLSIFNDTSSPPYLASAVAIDHRHILTAAHLVDIANSSYGGVQNLLFNLNCGSNYSSVIPVVSAQVAAGWGSFANDPNHMHDDIAVMTLASDIPAGVPTYPLYTGALPLHARLTLVGYGISGYGTGGAEVPSLFTVKRAGANAADQFLPDDEGSGKNEVYMFDFDGPTSATNVLGGTTLGNNVETTLYGGDSGGPAFYDDGGVWKIAGINAFLAKWDGYPGWPFFGSGGGGNLVAPHGDFVTSATPEPGALSLVLMAGLLALRRRRSV